MSDAASEVYGRNSSHPNSNRLGVNIIAALRDLAQVVTAIALVFIGFFALQTNHQQFKLQAADTTERQELLVDVEDLVSEKRTLSNEISALRAQIEQAEIDLGTAEFETRARQRETQRLRRELQVLASDKAHLESEYKTIFEQQANAILSDVEARLSSQLQIPIHHHKVAGWQLSDHLVVAWNGDPKTPKPLQHYYPKSANEIWALLVDRANSAVNTVPVVCPRKTGP